MDRSEMNDLQVDIITAEEASKITQDALVELEERRKEVLIIEIKRIENNIKCAAKKGKNRIDLSISDEAASFLGQKVILSNFRWSLIRSEEWPCNIGTLSLGVRMAA